MLLGTPKSKIIGITCHFVYPRKQKTERQRDRETERQKDRETERQEDRKTERQRDRKTERQRDRKTERQRYRKTPRAAPVPLVKNRSYIGISHSLQAGQYVIAPLRLKVAGILTP